MVGGLASDEVIDTIASIEMHRQEVAKESGLEGSRSFALRKLQEALQRERQALVQDGSSPERRANAEALMAEIQRVKALRGASDRRPAQRGGPPRRPEGPGRESQPWQSK